MKIIILLLFPILLLGQSSIEINGRTNVSKFTCVNNKPMITKQFIEPATIKVPHAILLYVKDFKCNNKKMTREFREMLDMEQYPIISIYNDNFANTPTDDYSAIANVAMKGIENDYPILLNQNKNSWTAVKLLSLNDFKLDLPTIMGGLIYIKDEIEVNIHIQK